MVAKLQGIELLKTGDVRLEAQLPLRSRSVDKRFLKCGT
jgi:hypothetical protein